MAEVNYHAEYKQFFEEFAKTISPDDQLPVKVAGYNLCENELTGEIVDWILQYLSQKRCPSSLLAPLTTIVITEVRQAIKQNPAACGYLRENNVFHSLRLMQFVITGKVNEICLRYLIPGSIEMLPVPTLELPTSVCAIKNTRRQMEDRHTIIQDFHTVFDVPNAGLATYYGVFDGHAGTDAAIYSVGHLHQFLAESPSYPAHPEQALREAFLKTDEYFLEKSHRENLRSGTTGLCALLQHKEQMLYVGWVGDSQALLVTRGVAQQLVLPHKPERPDERKRIEDMGGCVMFWGMWRVNGQLAVSRAIGDLDYKPYVTADPDIQAIPLNDNQDFLILACDGLWDYVSEQDAVVSVYETIRQHPGDLEAVSQSLVQLSKQKGSLDNISVIVVFLTDPAKLAALDVWPSHEPETMDTSFESGPLQTNGSDPSYQKANLLLDLNTGVPSDKFKQDTTSPSATDLFFLNRPANGKEDTTYDDDDFGPETDVDAVDDVLLSPAIAAAKAAAAAAEMMTEICQAKDLRTEIEADLELQRQQLSAFDPVREPREETPTPPADEVPGGPVLAPEVDNVAESGEDSEDEWNYYKVEPSDKPAAEPPVKTAQEIEDDENMESRLNPNAAEFIPSPTATKPSLEEVLSASPCKGGVSLMDDVMIPSPIEFQQEVISRPADLDANNPFADNDNFFNTVPDVVSDDNECGVLEQNPYKYLENEPEFGDIPAQLNPFKTAEHLFDKSEVSSTNAEYGDETASSFVSDSEHLQKGFGDDLFNASLVESDFVVAERINDEMNNESQNSTDLFGLDVTQDSDANSVLTVSAMDQDNLPEILPESVEMAIDNEDISNQIDSLCQNVSNLATESQLKSPLLSPLSSPVSMEVPNPITSMMEDMTAFTNEQADVIRNFEEHSEQQHFSPFPDVIQESFNEIRHLQTEVASSEPAPTVFNDFMAPQQHNVDIIEEFNFTQFDTKSPFQEAPVEQFAPPVGQFNDFFNGISSSEIVTEAVIEAVSQVESTVGGLIETEELTATDLHTSIPAEVETEIAVPEVDTNEVTDDQLLATVAATAVGVAAGAAAAALTVETVPSKDITKKDPKKPDSDKAKPAAKPTTGTRSPVKAPLKSTPVSPTKPLANSVPMAAPRSSTPKKPAPAATNRVASKPLPTASKVSATATSNTTSKTTASATSQIRAKVGAVPSTKPLAPTKVAPVKAPGVSSRPRPATTTSVKPTLTEKKPALSNGDAKPLAKRPEQLITKKLVPTATTKPLVRPASAPVAAKTTKTSTVTRPAVSSASTATAKPATKPAVNGTSKPKTAPLISAPRAKPAAATPPKTGVVDKQVKETANKQISRTVVSKTSTVTKTASSTGPRRVPGTATKTTTVTTTSNNKPSGPIRRPPGTTVTKSTTTKVVEGPLDVDQMVIVEEVTTIITKDESPIVDNAHIEVIASTD